MKIANRKVNVGDSLFSKRLQRFGVVTSVNPAMSIVEFMGNNKSPAIQLRFTQGGYVNSNRDLYWHADLELDLPFRDLSNIQEALDFLIKFKGIRK